MKFIVNISRIFVGALFIFSGFIKLNDPLGFSYKLQEYFSYDVLDLPVFIPYALGLSIFVVVFEVILGVFLLIGYKPKFTVWSLLGMIVFFTFLTFYAAYFDKVKDCGCFGDFLKLTPWQSFGKDLILLFFILILFVGQKHIKPMLSKFGLTVSALLSFIVCLWFGYHVLMHLPLFDFRAYKIGDNLQENMKLPADAKDAIIDYNWTYTLDGKENVITDRGRGPKTYDKIIGVETITVQEGDVPKIQDFSIESEDEDLTQQFLETEKLVMIVSYNLDKAEADGLAKMKAMADEAKKKGYTVIGLTASGTDKKKEIQDAYDLDAEFYLCDEKVLKTIVRANPGVVVFEKGKVTQKAHWNDIDDLEF
ncbi:BT_3928 family protein [Psychroserpens jangbogonensis]|uniref:BT_3928 family protein n=1 Tax=Psychroserpens jangbogonensis TaxID=1484460 RepID=UPI00053E9596|nr:BT_3928 family protein [Psychroserpens jangbogonensis]